MSAEFVGLELFAAPTAPVMWFHGDILGQSVPT